jgi:hypothetical protein
LGISANSLVVGYYDESGTLQQTFTPNIDTVNHKVTLQISHFSTWALIGSIVASTTTTTAPLPTSATTTTPAPPSSTATTIPPPAKGTNWGLIIGIIGGVVVIAIVIAVVVTRKKK